MPRGVKEAVLVTPCVGCGKLTANLGAVCSGCLGVKLRRNRAIDREEFGARATILLDSRCSTEPEAEFGRGLRIVQDLRRGSHGCGTAGGGVRIIRKSI